MAPHVLFILIDEPGPLSVFQHLFLFNLERAGAEIAHAYRRGCKKNIIHDVLKKVPGSSSAFMASLLRSTYLSNEEASSSS